MSVTKRGNFWWTDGKVKGIRYQENTGIETGTSKKDQNTSRKLAEAWEATRKDELTLRTGKGFSKAKLDALTFSKAARGFIDGKTYKSPKTKSTDEESLNRLLPHIGDIALRDFVRNPVSNTVDCVKAYVDHRLAQANGDTRKNRTINLDLTLIRKVLKVHNKWEPLKPIFKELWRVENSDVGKAIGPDEVARLLEAAKLSDSRAIYPALVLSIHTGLRSQELRTLLWSSVNLKTGLVKVEKSKTKQGKGREIYLNDTGLEILKNWRKNFPNAKPEHYVFPSEMYRLEKGRKSVAVVTNPEKMRGKFDKGFKTALKRAGIVNTRWHDLRHTAASLMAAGKVPDVVLDKLLGWDLRSKMRERYLHSTIAAKRAAASVMLDIK
jgi:integrase